MRWILRITGHGMGVVGALIGVGAIARAIRAGVPRVIPYAHSLTKIAVGGPLSLGLLGIALLLIDLGRGG